MGEKQRNERQNLAQLFAPDPPTAHPLEPGFICLRHRTEQLAPIVAELKVGRGVGGLPDGVAHARADDEHGDDAGCDDLEQEPVLGAIEFSESLADGHLLLPSARIGFVRAGAVQERTDHAMIDVVRRL